MADNSSNTELYIYRLTLGNTITAPSKDIAELQFEQGVRKDFSDGTNTYYVIFRGIQINRKIYQPTEIEAELDFMQVTKDDKGKDTNTTKAPEFDTVSALLLQRQVRLEIVKVDRVPDTSHTMTYKGEYEVAKNCYVYELNPQLKRDANGTKMYVKLNIFSMDKLMTLNKYSKAYVARKLGSGILKPESLQFGTISADVPLVDTNIENIQHLVYKDGNNKREFIQPYLVQYNETFYDFLVRTANRCGEFLYFEDGKLTLGLVKSEEDVQIDKYESVTVQNISADLITASDYSRDSVKEREKDDNTNEMKIVVGKLNQSTIDRQETHFPKDAFPSNISSNSEIASEDYFFPLYKDKFTNLEREMYYDGSASDIAMAHAVPFFKTLLENETAGGAGAGASVAKALLVGEGVTTGLALKQVYNVNPEKWETYAEKWKDKDKWKDKGEQLNSSEVVEFATLNEKGWTTLSYYNNIHKYEVAQGRKIVCVNLGTNVQNVKLGQQITIEGLTAPYVIIQIQQISEVAWNATYDKYDTDTADRYAGKRSLKIYAIPACKDKGTELDAFYPPVHPIPVIRKAGPQTAYVTANEDPMFQGRVRIAFPWQSLGGTEKETLAAAEQKLKEVQADIKKLEAEIKEWEDKEKKAKAQLDTLKEYVKASPEERMKILAKKIQDKEEIDNDLRKIQANLQKKRSEQDVATDEATKQKLKAEITKLETDEKEKKQELSEATAYIDDLKAAAKEHDRRKDKDDYKVIEDHNSVIKPYNQVYVRMVQELIAAKTKKERAETEEQKTTEKRDQIAAVVEKKVEEMSSPWVRISSPFATPGGGTFFRPRVGDEVLVNFENDNVERPYVVGSLYSKNNVTPDEGLYRKAAPELQWKDISMSIMSPNGHHLTFTDPPGGGNFFSNLISPGIGFYGSVAGAGALFPTAKDLAGGIHIGDRYGIYEIEMKSHKRAIDIKSPFGTVSINAFSGITISAPNGDVTIKGKNINIEAGNKLSLLSGKNIKDETPSTIGSKILGTVGTVAGELTDKFITSVVDFSLIRHVVEVFLRPVDGTMLIKSKRYLRLEAGHGQTTIASNRYNANQGEESQQAFFMALIECIKFLTSRSDQLFDTWDTLWDQAMKKRDAYMEIAKEVLKDPNKPDIPAMVFNYTEWKEDDFILETFEEHLKHDADPAYAAVRALFGELKEEEKKEVEKEERREEYSKIKQAAIDYGKSLFEVKDYDKNEIDRFLNTLDLELNSFSWLCECISIANVSLIEKFPATLEASQFKESENLPNLKSKGKFTASNGSKYLRRVMVLMFLDKVNQSAQNKAHKYMDLGMDLNKAIEETSKSSESGKEFYWYNVIQKMDRKGAKGWLQNDIVRTLWDNTIAKVWDKLKSAKPAADNKMWENTPDGQILFSDQDNATLNFQGEGLHRETAANQGTMEYLKKVLLKV